MKTQLEVQQFVAKLIAEAMYMQPGEIQEHELFSNFGLESLTLVKLTDKINRELGLNIGAKSILQHQTLHDASSFIYAELSGKQSSRQEGTPL